MSNGEWLDAIKWDADGLVPAIAQDAGDGRILMMAWMNREALRLTAEGKTAVYWSRSRQRLWHKGEESGHVQQVVAMYFTPSSSVTARCSCVQNGGNSTSLPASGFIFRSWYRNSVSPPGPGTSFRYQSATSWRWLNS